MRRNAASHCHAAMAAASDATATCRHHAIMSAPRPRACSATRPRAKQPHTMFYRHANGKTQARHIHTPQTVSCHVFVHIPAHVPPARRARFAVTPCCHAVTPHYAATMRARAQLLPQRAVWHALCLNPPPRATRRAAKTHVSPSQNGYFSRHHAPLRYKTLNR